MNRNSGDYRPLRSIREDSPDLIEVLTTKPECLPKSQLLEELTKPEQQDPTKQKLKLLFVHYAQLGDKLNTTNLKSSQFIKLLTDAGVKANHKVDLIYKSISKNKMNYDDFLDSLV